MKTLRKNFNNKGKIIFLPTEILKILPASNQKKKEQ